jgi:MraZ protein
MLSGEFKHTLDAKGRIFIPAKFRTDLGQTVMISRGFGKYLTVYSVEEWKIFTSKLEKLGQGKQARDLQRYVSMNCKQAELDSQGRINVDQALREFAGLTKDVSFVGMTHYVEMWDGAVLEAETKSYDSNEFDALLEKAYEMQ